MALFKKIDGMLNTQSWISLMFEGGLRMEAKHGKEKVFDFSLGNPNMPAVA